MNKKGFTLVELLAVLVILAIISLIIIPIVGDSITKSRKSAFETSAYQLIKAADIYFANYRLENGSKLNENKEFIIQNGEFVGDKLSVSGELPESGKLTLTANGEIAFAISNGVYCITKTTSEPKITLRDLSEESCIYKRNDNSANQTDNPVIVSVTDSELHKYTNSSKSTLSPTLKGKYVKIYDIKLSDSITEKFILLDENETTLILLMKNNIGGSAWSSSSDLVTPDVASQYLIDQTSNWKNIDQGIIRLPAHTEFINTFSTTNTVPCDGSSCPTIYVDDTCLFDNSFWFSDVSASNNAWYFKSDECLNKTISAKTNIKNVRPVIELPKKIGI